MMVSTLLLCTLIGLSSSHILPDVPTHFEDTSYWMKSGQENLRKILSLHDNENQARNIIIFIGDGMGMTSVTAGRIFQGQKKGGSGEEYKLNFEQFPNTGLSKTYNVDKQVPDSAATATAMFSGVKCRYKVIGLDSKAIFEHCDKTVNKRSRLSTIAEWAQVAGKDTGFVTTARVTHATPAALYAHVNSRNWECDTEIPNDQKDCTKDIARQLVEDAPGSNFKVIMGGGAQPMGTINRQIDTDVCIRNDSLNITDLWQKKNPQGKFVANTGELMNLDIGSASNILGIFAPNHLPYHAVRDVSEKGSPSLANMTLQAIRMLRRNKNGFFLMVESGRIDMAHHSNYAKHALHEVGALEEAVQVALDQVNVEETLIIVTADHSHAFTMNGYPERGNDILGLANKPGDVAYETLAYTNGPGFIYHRINDTSLQGPNNTWRSVADDPNRGDPWYRNFAGFYIEDETHGGEDVPVYAVGPYSHLFRGTFEQNYIAHAVAYAGCLQNWPSHCDNSYHHGRAYSKGTTLASSSLHLATFAFVCVGIALGNRVAL
ncbi:alkaline phosphatase 4-like isoform X2 [Neodiprion pinetum]|uniref:alkaline phosphatase 4-like isoform X1 n=1 Tax=Neodiprion fabricii TaxID=2872261 RepID=UPI001ED94221|nr:alkaline phosphatase 4-like isoform X1 [Neodiprion fabricii]XP_046427032.1 alkaline phosphatase 4-like isoform X1 [Neodiprion fabricii]XP_046483603.1 alkaline phosphatase 4-like isoform X2 [Neodiprion pinetum]XP_046483604.1 alkaline phosphatase 4-like isoform X2 [Neodiprion pinetum]